MTLRALHLKKMRNASDRLELRRRIAQVEAVLDRAAADLRAA